MQEDDSRALGAHGLHREHEVALFQAQKLRAHQPGDTHPRGEPDHGHDVEDARLKEGDHGQDQEERREAEHDVYEAHDDRNQ